MTVALTASGLCAAILVASVVLLMRRVRSLEAGLAERTGKLHAFAVELIRAEEDQRSRIARELHDGLGQMMTAVNIELQMLRESAPPELQSRVDDVSALSKQVMAEMRRISHELRPAILDEMGLADAVRALVNRLSRHSGLEVQLRVDGSMEVMPADSVIACYRLVQEALNNVVRHSGAMHASVRLSRDGSWLEAVVADDGKGIDYDPAAKVDGHFGLMGLEERIRAIGGEFQFGRADGGGTRVAARLPV